MRVLEGGVGAVELEVAGRVTRERLVRAGHVVGSQEIRHARQVHGVGDVLEDPVAVDQPGHVELARSQRGHLPVEHRHRSEVPVHHVADAGVTPARHRRPLLGRPVRVQPGESPLDQRRASSQPGGGEVVPRPGVAHPPPQRRVAGSVVGQEVESFLGAVDGVQFGQDGHGGVLEPALIGGVGVEQPAVAEVVGHDVGRHLAVDPSHHEERRAERNGVGLRPPHRRHRHGRQLVDQADRAVLPVEVIAGEHGHVGGVGRHPGHQSLGAVGHRRGSTRRRTAGSRSTSRWPRCPRASG